MTEDTFQETLTISEFRKNLYRYMDRIVCSGESFRLKKKGMVVAIVGPIPTGKGPRSQK